MQEVSTTLLIIRRWSLRVGAMHVLLVAAGIGMFLVVRGRGEELVGPGSAAPGAAADAGAPPFDALLQVLLALAVVVACTRMLGSLVRLIGQPPVIGEIIAGILLGPSLLGRLAPGVFNLVFPTAVGPFLGVIAQLGVILYMFLVGLELDVRTLRRSGPSLAAISNSSIVVPFVLGSLLALHLYSIYAPPGVSFTSFALFLGVSVSVTAFPVLARILTDRGIHRTPFGSLSLGCAAIDDVAAWCLLAVAVSSVHSDTGSAVRTILLTILFFALMVVVIRPVLGLAIRYLERRERLSDGGIALLSVAVLLSASTTEVIGIHAIFGAFLLGAMTPRGRVSEQLMERMQDLVRVLFLPAFFAYTGLRTQIGLMTSLEDWVFCGLLIAAGTAGKWGAGTLAARVSGVGWRDAAALGILMNTRGLVGLIVLNIGLDLKIISPTLFTMLVIMALVTTIATPPIFELITRKRPWAQRAST